ncbi:MAG: adenylate/guanylate cyclase domain-containing protein [Pseudomonadota bacterium]
MHRNLTAVLAADVVGYSQLMGADAESTLVALRRLRREVFGPAVAAKRGRVIKSLGDGWIVAFNAVADAVECAMQVQDQTKFAGDMKLRIGVHLGDIVEEDDDVYGSGINIAVRLQNLAEPGALAISGPTRDLLDGARRHAFDDAGPRVLKNINEPIRTWVRGGDIAGCAAELAEPGFPQLTIQPVKGLGGPDVEAVAEALTGDLAAYADATRWLEARLGSAPVAGTYHLACSLRFNAGRARLEATLTGPARTRVATEKFDGRTDDIFAFQDEVAIRLASQALRWIIARENTKIDDLPDDALTAENWAMRGLAADGLSDETYARILDCISQAMELRPNWGYIHAAGLAVLTAGLVGGHLVAVGPYLSHLSDWAAMVDELEPPHSPARVMLAHGDYQAGGSAAAAGAEARRILRGLPFDPETLFWAGLLFIRIGEVREGLDCLEALERGPQIDILHRGALFWRGLANVMLGNDETALQFAALSEEPGVYFAPLLRLRASASAHLGRSDDAARYLAQLLKRNPNQTVRKVRNALGFQTTRETERYLNGLKLAGMPE